MAEYHYSCYHLPYGDLFTEADTPEIARKNFIRYIWNKVTPDRIDPPDEGEESYSLSKNEVIEEH